MHRIAQFVLVVVFAGLAGCGGSQTLLVGNNPADVPIGIGGSPGTPIQYATDFPSGLPQDALQPWEELGADGNVIPGGNKGVSATSGATEFFEGPQTHLESGNTAEWNGALRMASGNVGAGNLSYAIYRIPLGGSEPGVVSVDANIRPMGDGTLGGYFVGLADYGNNSWQWFGPITDAHWRISSVQSARDGALFTSGVGSVFVCVVAFDGAAVDIVGIGIDPVDLGDTTAPDVPSNLVLTPVAGGIELAWTAVGGNDVAGYKVYYKDKAFGEFTAQFANTVEGLQGRSFILGAGNQTWVAVSAVDKSGNESAISAVESARPLVGQTPELRLAITTYSAMRGELVSLTASGASLYDWDTDGDGIFDILDDPTGTADVDTSQTGLIRPLVRGVGSDSTSVAMNAVSVIVSSNSRPVAVANATPAFGNAPLDVAFSGTDSTDFDGSIVGGGWDYDGDGFYDDWEDLDIVHVTSANNTYTDPGVYNAKLRVVDNEGAWDVDTVTVVVYAVDPGNDNPTADLVIAPGYGDVGDRFTLDASGSSDGDGSIVNYEWDFDGDGAFDSYGISPTNVHTYLVNGVFTATVRVTDNSGGQATASASVRINEVFDLDHPWPSRGHDIRNTGRSQYLGPQTNNIAWTFPTGGSILSSPAIGSDGTVYFGSRDRKLYAINQDGSEKWSFLTGNDVESSPVIGVDGTVYVGSDDRQLYAIYPDGTKKWSFDTGDDIYSSPVVDSDGVIYFGCDNDKVFAVNPDGSLRWSFLTGHYVRSSPAIGADGTVYVGCNDWNLYAINPNGTLKWTFFTAGTIKTSLAIGPDGTVYVGCAEDQLYAIKPDGTLLWSYTTGGSWTSSPAIGADGTLYIGSRDTNIYAISPAGGLDWTYTTGDEIHSSPVVGADGTVYVACRDGVVYAINPDGSLLWSGNTGGGWFAESTPAIGADGMLYVGNEDGNLYAFGNNGGSGSNSTPTASLSIDPAYADEGVTITLDASGSSDSDGSIVNYEWDFDGDGVYDSYGSTNTTTHEFYTFGVFSSKVRVTDDLGAQDIASAEIRINEVFNLDTPWPARGHDDRHTGRSPYVGAQSNGLKWSYEVGDDIKSSPAIGADGTVYVGCEDNKLYAINADGTIRWIFPTGGIVPSSPAIGADGAVYMGSWDGKLYSVNPDGTERWSINFGAGMLSPTIGPDGVIYVGSANNRLYAVTPDGDTIWYFQTGGGVYSAPVIGGDETIYIGSYDDNLYAINPDGTEKWSYTCGNELRASAAIGTDGTVYIGCRNSKLYAINPDGTEQWTFDLVGDIWSSPSIGEDGTIYIGSDKLYAINPDGTSKGGNWPYTTLGWVNSAAAIGADGVIYVGTEANRLHAINPNGTHFWSYDIGGDIFSSPAIGADGTVFIGSYDNNLYAFGSGGAGGNTPPTADISATPTHGVAALDIEFDASGSSDSDGNIVNYEWDFNGDGQYDSYGPSNSARHTYAGADTYVVKVRVTDDRGAQDTATVTVVALANRMQVDTTDDVGQFSSMLVVSGNPAICYYDNTSFDLTYVRATNISGSTWGTPVSVDTTSDVGQHAAMAIVNGNPAISYYDATADDLRYVRATDATGSAWGAPVTADSGGDVGKYTSLVVANGNPAISYYDVTNGNLKYVRANDVSGTTWDTPAAVDSTGDVGSYTSMVMVNSNPGISYFDLTNGKVKFVRATTVSGSSWNTPFDVSTSGVGTATSLFIINGFPAVTYNTTSSGYLKYRCALNVSGTTWGTIYSLDTNNAGAFLSMVEVDYNPVVCYYDSGNNDLRIIIGTNWSGSSWDTSVPIDTVGSVGKYSSMTIVESSPAISYYDETNGDLKYLKLY